MLNWLTRAPRTTAPKAQRSDLRFETLEARELPAITIQIDYSHDTSGFFTNNPTAQAVMQQAANQLAGTLNANLSAITPSGGNTWTATFIDPSTGVSTSVSNLTIAADTLVVYVGAGNLNNGLIGYGTSGGMSAAGSSSWVSSTQTRDWSGFSTWGGDIEFDKNQNWYFGSTTSGLGSNQYDFYSVALHELGRVLGIGTSNQWFNLSSNGSFTGAAAEAVYGGPVPETSTYSGWATGVTDNGAQASMDPAIAPGQRVNWTSLDAAALTDLGWTSGSSSSTATSTATPNQTSVTTVSTSPPTVALSGSTNGTVSLFSVVNGTLYQNGQAFTPFPGYTGPIQMASGDFTGDGVTDYAFATGAGSTSVIEVINGSTGAYLVPPTALFGAYSGGLYLAAGDIDHNGRDQLVVAGENAPPIVLIYQVANGGLQLQTSFMAFDAPTFSGGIRVAVGDLNGDGYADVVVSTASQVGAIATYSGEALSQGVASELYPVFFPVPGSTVGINVAVGDLEGNGYDDLIISFESGGPGVVAVWSGKVLTQNANTSPMNLPLAALFVAVPGNSGARVAAVDVDGSGTDELIVGSENPSDPVVRVFTFAQAQAGGAGAAYSHPLGTSSVNGVYIA